MPGRTAVASASGAAVGVTATIALTGRQPEDDALSDLMMMLVWLFAMICITIVASASTRRWIKARDASNQQTLEDISRQRSTLLEVSAARMAELKQREDRVNKQAEMAGAYVMSLTGRLDQALTRVTQLERSLNEMTGRYEDLARDHNMLIRETLQERADRFTRRTITSARSPLGTPTAPPAPDNNPARPYADPDAGHAPVAPIPFRIPSPKTRPVSDQPRHDRPAEGVAGPVS
ncbi:hypothetical protein [Streptomyces sp. NPDC001068]|uniref:hypothetical protein n=1 Tax=Streptomyces sp. NPDC001068 TaxID=3364544 RepID=UPI0036C800EF